MVGLLSIEWMHYNGCRTYSFLLPLSSLTTRTMVVNDHRGPAGNDSQGVPGFNPCLGDVNINGTTVNYLNYLVRKTIEYLDPISSITTSVPFNH